MPLFASFSASSSRSLGLTSGAPPGPPTIDSSSSTATTYTINFTPVLGSFDIARFEYSLNGGAFTGSISSSATSHTVTGLVPSTAYTLQIRAVDSAGQISDGSNVNSRSTTAEIAPSAPTVTVTQLESGSGTPINATRLSVSFTAAPAGTYSVAYHQYRVYRGATLITDWTTTPVGAGVAFPLTGLNTATAHTVDVRGVATGNGTTFGSVGSGTATTDTEIANSAPSVTIVSQDTANVTFDRSNSTGGTYGVSYYQYLVVRNADGVWVASGTLSTSATRYTIATGVSPDQYFTIYLAAISLTSGTQGASGSAVGQLEPGTPTIGTLNWQGGMSANGTTAYLYAVAGSYNYDAYLVINGSTQVAGTLSGGIWYWTVGLAFNQSYSFAAYSRNRRFTSSSMSNNRYFTTPHKGVSFRFPSSADYTEKVIALQGTCGTTDIGNMVLTLPSSAATENEVGYKYINTINCEFAELLTHRETSGGLSNLNSATRDTQWQIVSGGTPSGWSSAFGIAFTEGGLDYNPPPNFTAGPIAYGFYMGGSDINGKTVKVAVNGTGWGQYQSNCSPPTTFAFRARNFYVEGYQTVAGSFS
jgi:hypothetical protein